MSQLHKKFTIEQVKVLLDSYEKGHLGREEIQNTLDVGKTRFFALLKQYRISPVNFSIDYHRKNKSRLSKEVEDQIRSHLLQEKELVEDNDIPITTYNYTAITDRLKKLMCVFQLRRLLIAQNNWIVIFPRKRKKLDMIAKSSLHQLAI